MKNKHKVDKSISRGDILVSLFNIRDYFNITIFYFSIFALISTNFKYYPVLMCFSVYIFGFFVYDIPSKKIRIFNNMVKSEKIFENIEDIETGQKLDKIKTVKQTCSLKGYVSQVLFLFFPIFFPLIEYKLKYKYTDSYRTLLWKSVLMKDIDIKKSDKINVLDQILIILVITTSILLKAYIAIPIVFVLHSSKEIKLLLETIK